MPPLSALSISHAVLADGLLPAVLEAGRAAAERMGALLGQVIVRL